MRLGVNMRTCSRGEGAVSGDGGSRRRAALDLIRALPQEAPHLNIHALQLSRRGL